MADKNPGDGDKKRNSLNGSIENDVKLIKSSFLSGHKSDDKESREEAKKKALRGVLTYIAERLMERTEDREFAERVLGRIAESEDVIHGYMIADTEKGNVNKGDDAAFNMGVDLYTRVELYAHLVKVVNDREHVRGLLEKLEGDLERLRGFCDAMANPKKIDGLYYNAPNKAYGRGVSLFTQFNA